MSSLYEKAYLAYDAASKPGLGYAELATAVKALGDLLNQFGTGDLAAVVNVAQNYVGENAHLMEPDQVADLRDAIERLEGVYR